jgi:hypothetical protein
MSQKKIAAGMVLTVTISALLAGTLLLRFC